MKKLFLIIILIIGIVSVAYANIIQGRRGASEWVTYVLGDDTTYSAKNSNVGTIDKAMAQRNGYSATVSVASGQNVIIGIDINNINTGPDMKMWITDNSGNAITDFIEFTPVNGNNEVTATLNANITASSIYYIAFICTATISLSNSSDEWYQERDTSGTYATPPDPMSFGSRDNIGKVTTYVRLP